MKLARSETGTPLKNDISPLTVADLRGGARDARPPSRPNCFHFHAVFGKNWANSMLAPPPLWGWRTPFWEILDPPLTNVEKTKSMSLDFSLLRSGWCTAPALQTVMACRGKSHNVPIDSLSQSLP